MIPKPHSVPTPGLPQCSISALLVGLQDSVHNLIAHLVQNGTPIRAANKELILGKGSERHQHPGLDLWPQSKVPARPALKDILVSLGPLLGHPCHLLPPLLPQSDLNVQKVLALSDGM